MDTGYSESAIIGRVPYNILSIKIKFIGICGVFWTLKFITSFVKTLLSCLIPRSTLSVTTKILSQ